MADLLEEARKLADEIFMWVRQQPVDETTIEHLAIRLNRFAAERVAAENEACAALLDKEVSHPAYAARVQSAIRARRKEAHD